MLDSIIQLLRNSFTEQLLRDPVWGTIGFTGQAVFGARFIVQWIASEFKKRPHVPGAFWFISLAGSIILLAYSLHIRNPVFILGFSLNTLIYIRNIHLLHKNAHARRAEMIKKEFD